MLRNHLRNKENAKESRKMLRNPLRNKENGKESPKGPGKSKASPKEPEK